MEGHGPAAAHHRPVGRLLRATLAAALAYLVVAGAAGLAALWQGVGLFRDIKTTDLPLLLDNAELLQALTDAGSALQAFVITGDEALLETFGSATARFSAAGERAGLRAPSEGVGALIEAQRWAGEQWIAEYADPLVQLRRVHAGEALARARDAEAQRWVDELRAANAATAAAAGARVDEQLRQARQHGMVAGSLLAGLVLAGLLGGLLLASRTARAAALPLPSGCQPPPGVAARGPDRAVAHRPCARGGQRRASLLQQR